MTLPVDGPAPTRRAAASWRRDAVLSVALGAALLVFARIDGKAYRASAGTPPLIYSLVESPGGARMGPALELFPGCEAGYLRLANFSALEFSPGHPYRHGLGPVSTLEIFSPAQTANLAFRFISDWPGQELIVTCNGQELDRLAAKPAAAVTRTYPLALHAGGNVVTFAYRHYNHDGACEMADPRTIAGTFLQLDLREP